MTSFLGGLTWVDYTVKVNQTVHSCGSNNFGTCSSVKLVGSFQPLGKHKSIKDHNPRLHGKSENGSTRFKEIAG